MSNEIKVPADVNYAHVITMVYLFIAGYSDGEFSQSEVANHIQSSKETSSNNY